MSSNKSNRIDAAILFGGLVPVLIACALFILFPMYQLLDMSVVRRPVWNPPRIVVREAFQDLTPEDIARMERDPRQREFVEGLKKPIIFEPKPSWLGYRKRDPNRPLRGPQYPPNGLLYFFLGSVALYACALKYRGIL